MRADIGHRIGEDVGPLLFDEARLLAGILGLVIELARFLAALDLAFDDAAADLHMQRIDRGLLRQGKYIHAFEPTITRVLEALGDDGAGNRAGDGNVDVGVETRRLDELALLAALEQESARIHVAGVHEIDGGGGAAACLGLRLEGVRRSP